MKQRPERIGTSIGYFDSRTGFDLTTSRSVEITSECPAKMGGNAVVYLDFTQATEGVMVKITECYPDSDYGSSVANFVDDLDDLTSNLTANFCMFAKMFGLMPEQLVLFVRQKAPSLNRTQLLTDFRTYSNAPDGKFDYCMKKAGLTPSDIMQ